MEVLFQFLLTLSVFISLSCSTTVSASYFSNENLSVEKLKSCLSAEYTSNNGKKVYVFDGALSYSLLIASRVYFSSNDEWRYVLFDKYVVDSSDNLDHGNSIPWKSWQNPTVVSGTRMGATLQALVQTAFSNAAADGNASRSGFQLAEIYSAISRRGDVTQLHRDYNRTGESPAMGYSAVVFTNTVWRKNSYGEMLFYEDHDDFDAFAVVSPHFGRVIIWDSSIRYLPRSPSNNELSGQYMIFAQFHSEPKVVFEKRTFFDRYLDEVKAARKKGFVFADDAKDDNVNKDNDDDTKSTSLDLDKHLTLRRYNKAGESVAVFDGLFAKDDLDTLRTHTVKYGKYFYDDILDLTSDNVQWIAGFEVKKFVATRFWPIIKQVATYVSGVDTWYPYDVACNLIRSADHTRFHLDTSYPEEEEMTFLLYLSPNWTASNYGETAFMELNIDSPDNDYVAEVVPLYGRAVIFGGNFPHSAHPPSPDYEGPRYTFAVKLSVNKYAAVVKTFHEEMKHSAEHVREMMREIKTNHELFASKQKVSIVTSYLEGRQVMETIASKAKTEDNVQMVTFDEDMKAVEHLLRFSGGDGDVTLDREKQHLLLSMLKHHGVLEMFLKTESSTNDDEEHGGLHQSTLAQDEDDRSWMDVVEEKIESWKKLCEEDADCLQDYLGLFLEQQREFNRRIIQELLAII